MFDRAREVVQGYMGVTSSCDVSLEERLATLRYQLVMISPSEVRGIPDIPLMTTKSHWRAVWSPCVL